MSILKVTAIYKTQVRFDDCRGPQKRLPFDFQVMLKNGLEILVEVDGDQHRQVIYNEKSFKNIQRSDYIKTVYCNSRDIKLVRIKYRYTGWSLHDRIPYVIRQLEAALVKYDVPIIEAA